MINALRNSAVGYRRRGESFPTILKDGNTVAWFDSALKYITKNGTDLVSRWADRSGNANDLLQATESNRPLWGTDGVLWDGVDNFMKCVAFTLEQPEFVYIVFKQISWNNADVIFDGEAANSMHSRQNTSTPSLSIYAGTVLGDNGNLEVGTWGIGRMLFEGLYSKIQINETAPVDGDAGTSDGGGFTLGDNGSAPSIRASNIEVKEIIIRRISDLASDQLDIQNYLKNKYSLPLYPPTLLDSDTLAWFDFQENITMGAGNEVSIWGDKSGNANDLLQPTPGVRPLWSLSGVLFNGLDDFMKCVAFTLTQPETIYIIFRQVTWSNNRVILDGNTELSGSINQTSTTPALRSNAGSFVASANNSLAVGVWGIVRAVFNGASSSFQIDKTTQQTGDGGSNNMGGFTLGAHGGDTNWSNIEVKEVVVRDSADTAAEQLSVYNYLADKYGFERIFNLGLIGDSLMNRVGDDWVENIPDSYTIANHAASSANIIDEMDGQVVAAVDDDNEIIILGLGTNDDNAGDMGALQAEVEENIIEIKTSNPRATVYYMNVLPRWTDVGGGTEIDKSNIRTAIEAASAAQGIVCWDTYSDPWIVPSDTSDGTHPDEAGSLKVWNKVNARL